MLNPAQTPPRDLPSIPDALIRMRNDLNDIFQESMKSIDIKNLMSRAMIIRAGTLQVGNTSVPLHDKKNIVLIAVGKAALPMCTVAAALLQPSLEQGQSLRGIAVGPGDPSGLPHFVQYFAGAHPLPNQTSRDAAEAAMEMLTPLGSNDLVLFLLSGGASAMFEAPMDPSISCEEMEHFYGALVHSGLPITSMNALRKHFSRVKGGRLALAASPAEQLSLIVSDVPGDALDVVGSGPSLPDPSTVAECREILSQPAIRERLSPAILRYFDDAALAETAKPSHPAFRRSAAVCLLSNDILLEEVQRLARLAGYHAEIDLSCDDWKYEDAAAYLLNKVRTLRKMHKRVCLISGGELSVQVNGPGGLGGRNQHFLLHCAMSLKENDPDLALLSAGTDGVDGNSPAAGAIVDSSTAARIAKLGLDPWLALQRFDSYSLFHALGDTIVTGPTGNNVRDLRVILST